MKGEDDDEDDEDYDWSMGMMFTETVFNEFIYPNCDRLREKYYKDL